MSLHPARAEQIADEFDAELGASLDESLALEPTTSRSPSANVLKFEPAASHSGGTLEDHADFHRKAAAEHDHRKGQAQRDGKAAAAEFRAERKTLRDRYNAELAELSAREEEAKAEIAQRVVTADCLADVSRAAVRTIEKHL